VPSPTGKHTHSLTLQTRQCCHMPRPHRVAAARTSCTCGGLQSRHALSSASMLSRTSRDVDGCRRLAATAAHAFDVGGHTSGAPSAPLLDSHICRRQRRLQGRRRAPVRAHGAAGNGAGCPRLAAAADSASRLGSQSSSAPSAPPLAAHMRRGAQRSARVGATGPAHAATSAAGAPSLTRHTRMLRSSQPAHAARPVAYACSASGAETRCTA
jgi:hypothetical protein